MIGDNNNDDDDDIVLVLSLRRYAVILAFDVKIERDGKVSDFINNSHN